MSEGAGSTMKKEIKIQKQKEFLISIAFWSVWILIAFLFLKAAGSILLPFVLAFAVAWLLASPVDFVAKQTRIRRNFISVILVIGFYVLLGAAVYLLGSRLMYLLYDTIADISAFFVETVIPILQRFFRWLERTIPMAELLPAYEKQSGKENERIGTLFLGMSGGLMDGISSMAAGLPGLFMNMLITVIATVFMELEFHKIFDFLKKQVPEEYQRLLVDGKGYVAGTLGKCFGSYCLIFGITFLELCLGLFLLGIKRAVVLAFVTAVLDILPVLGTGTVLIPWAVIAVAAGNVRMGIGIGALYLIITIVRNIVEPKLVGHQMGLSPVVMLPCMLIGLKLFGIIGLFLVPLGVAVLKACNDRGIISVFRT